MRKSIIQFEITFTFILNEMLHFNVFHNLLNENWQIYFTNVVMHE